MRLPVLVMVISGASFVMPPAAASIQRGRGAQSPALQSAMQLLREDKTDEALAAVKRELESNRLSMQAANLLDVLGANAEARVVFQRIVDAAAEPAAKAAAQRAMAMSFGFSGDCANAVKYEQMVIAYWTTREQAEPQNAFYQQGEMANEAARVCIDAGDLATAERWYRTGSELGLKEPEPRTHPKSLWDYRLAHALGRLAARRGDQAEAARQIAAARKALDGDPAMARDQERFFPYLVGYVALHTNDLVTAEVQLTKAIELNESDPFMLSLLGMTYEKTGRGEKARETYEKAYALATAHNPPAAFARPFARSKLQRPQ